MLESSTSYINAGGRGTRLLDILPPHSERGIAKALLAQPGCAPIIDYHIFRSLDAGYRNVVVNSGDQELVTAYVAQKYAHERRVTVIAHKQRRGTGFDLLHTFMSTPDLFGVHTVVSNVDTLLDVSDREVTSAAVMLGALSVLVATRRKNVPNEGAFKIARDGQVWHSDEFKIPTNVAPLTTHLDAVSSCGMVAFTFDCLDALAQDDLFFDQPDEEISIYRHLLPKIAYAGGLFVYDNEERDFLDIGTPENYARFQGMVPLIPQEISAVA